MEVSELQVYLVNNGDKILRKFQKVSDPCLNVYGIYSFNAPIEKKEKEMALRSLSAFFEGGVKETLFPDVLSVTAPEGKSFPKVLPKWIKRVESNPLFNETVQLVKKGESAPIRVLPNLPPLSDALKERLNLECMLWGLEGKTILADAQSVWGEMPAVTVFANSPTALFSKTFKRSLHALYQKHHVNTYLWDPDVKSRLREIEFFSEGRAAPDIYIEDLNVFLQFLEKVNATRIKKDLPLIGFLNPFFYQNAHAFKRPYTGSPVFPDSFALWSANRGLGIPHYGGLADAFENLGGGKVGTFQKWLKSFHLFPSNQD
jgi:hypothetical protein